MNKVLYVYTQLYIVGTAGIQYILPYSREGLNEYNSMHCNVLWHACFGGCALDQFGCVHTHTRMARGWAVCPEHHTSAIYC